MTLQVAYPYDRRSLEPRPLRAREIVRFLACPRRGAGGDRAAGRPDRDVRGAGAVRARSCDAFERTHFSLVGHCEGGKIPEAVFRPHHGWHAATRFETHRRSSFTCGISGRARELVAPQSRASSMDAVVRRAISKVVMTDNGGLRIEMHDKIAALNKLARALGMYTEKRDFKPNTHPVTAVTIYEGRPAPWPAPDEPALASRQVTRSAVPTHPRSTGRIRSMLAEP